MSMVITYCLRKKYKYNTTDVNVKIYKATL